MSIYVNCVSYMSTYMFTYMMTMDNIHTYMPCMRSRHDVGKSYAHCITKTKLTLMLILIPTLTLTLLTLLLCGHSQVCSNLGPPLGGLPTSHHNGPRVKITSSQVSGISTSSFLRSSKPTRSADGDKFCVLSSWTDPYKYSFYPHTIFDWNALPASVKSHPSIHLFCCVIHSSLTNSI